MKGNQGCLRYQPICLNHGGVSRTVKALPDLVQNTGTYWDAQAELEVRSRRTVGKTGKLNS